MKGITEMKNALVKQSLTALVAVGVLSLTNISALAAELAGTVQGANQPIAAATVTLYAAAEGAPSQVAQTKTGAEGKFGLDAERAPKGSVFYLVAKGPKEGVALMSLLGPSLPQKVMVNELTTVASTFCAAQVH